MTQKIKIEEVDEDCEDCGSQNAENEINNILIQRSKKTEKDLKQYIY